MDMGLNTVVITNYYLDNQETLYTLVQTVTQCKNNLVLVDLLKLNVGLFSEMRLVLEKEIVINPLMVISFLFFFPELVSAYLASGEEVTVFAKAYDYPVGYLQFVVSFCEKAILFCKVHGLDSATVVDGGRFFSYTMLHHFYETNLYDPTYFLTMCSYLLKLGKDVIFVSTKTGILSHGDAGILASLLIGVGSKFGTWLRGLRYVFRYGYDADRNATVIKKLIADSKNATDAARKQQEFHIWSVESRERSKRYVRKCVDPWDFVSPTPKTYLPYYNLGPNLPESEDLGDLGLMPEPDSLRLPLYDPNSISFYTREEDDVTVIHSGPVIELFYPAGEETYDPDLVLRREDLNYSYFFWDSASWERTPIQRLVKLTRSEISYMSSNPTRTPRTIGLEIGRSGSSCFIFPGNPQVPAKLSAKILNYFLRPFRTLAKSNNWNNLFQLNTIFRNGSNNICMLRKEESPLNTLSLVFPWVRRAFIRKLLEKRDYSYYLKYLRKRVSKKWDAMSLNLDFRLDDDISTITPPSTPEMNFLRAGTRNISENYYRDIFTEVFIFPGQHVNYMPNAGIIRNDLRCFMEHSLYAKIKSGVILKCSAFWDDGAGVFPRFLELGHRYYIKLKKGCGFAMEITQQNADLLQEKEKKIPKRKKKKKRR